MAPRIPPPPAVSAEADLNVLVAALSRVQRAIGNSAKRFARSTDWLRIDESEPTRERRRQAAAIRLRRRRAAEAAAADLVAGLMGARM